MHSDEHVPGTDKRPQWMLAATTITGFIHEDVRQGGPTRSHRDMS